MNKSIFSLTILILLIIFLRPENQLFSQTPGLNFRSLNMRNGLSYDDVRCIYQDKEGFMWFGNEGGADKFDGRDFQNYQKFIRDKALNTLQSTNRIYDDSYNGMWFINDTNGVVLMDKRSNTFTRFTVDPEDPGSISGKYARDILEDSHGNLWITTLDGGLNLFERKDSSFTHFQHDSSTSSGIGSNKLTSIAEDRNGMIWLGSPDGLLIRFDPVTFKFDNIRIKEPDAITWQEINDPALYVDANNNIWYGSRHELFRYDVKSGFVEYLPLKLAKGVQSAFITSLLELEPGVMLITTFNTGLFVYNIKTRKLVQYSYNPAYPFGINSNRLSQAYRSVDGVIWISSYDNGVNIYSKYALRFPMLTNLVNAQYLERPMVRLL